MNTEYPYKLDKLENDFANILDLDYKINNSKQIMKTKLLTLKDMHAQMSKTNNKQIFLFSLDSFYFQYKTFSMELENLNKFDSMFKNRMYCDYYKLYKLMLKYITENKDELKIEIDVNLTLPTYKDLEPFYDYGIENTKKVHATMLNYIKKMYSVVMIRERVIQDYATKAHAGYSISNFVNTLTHENNILKGQIDLYINYISFFHISQQKQINRLYNNYTDFDKEIENNLNSDHAFSFDDLVIPDNNNIPEPVQKQGDIIPEKIQGNEDIIHEKNQTGENETTIDNQVNHSNEIVPMDTTDLPVFKEIKDSDPA